MSQPIGEEILSRPTFKQILDALKRQILVGKSYLGLAKGLLAADPVILQTAPTFFGLTADGSLELAQMTIARLYDKTRGAVTIRTMLHDAVGQLDAFQRATPKQATDAILKWVRAVVALQPILDSIRTRRNEWLAHLDPRTVANTAALAFRAKLSIPDLDRAFHETEEIVLDLSSLYEGITGQLTFIGGDDYNTALDWIRKAKCTLIENYEKEFGAWPGSRPKDCSGGLLKMI